MNELNTYLKETINNNKLHKINKNVFLTTFEMDILKTNNIPYENCSNYNSILFLLEEILLNEDNPELEQISLSISERNYYQNTHK